MRISDWSSDVCSSDLDNDPQQQPAALLSAWKAGDTAYLQRLDVDMKHRYPSLYEHLLAARNRAWLPVLAARLKLPTAQMIIVGAAHLVDRKSTRLNSSH